MADMRIEERLLAHTRRPSPTCLVLMVLSVVFYQYVYSCIYDYRECVVKWSEEWTFYLDDVTFGLVLCLRLSLWQRAAAILCWMCEQRVLWLMAVWRRASLARIVCACVFLALWTVLVPLTFYMLWPPFVERLHGTIVDVEFPRYEDNLGHRFNDTSKSESDEEAWLNLFHRYNTEDVTFVCYFETSVPVSSDYKFGHIEWYKDYRLFQPTKHVSMAESGFITKPQSKAEVMMNTRLYYTTQTLLVPFLRDGDFGTYKCHVTIAYVNSSAGLQIRDTKESKQYFHLQTIPKLYKDVAAPPNAVVRLFVSHYSKEHDDTEILVDHRLDDIPLHALLEGDYAENRCFSLMILYKTFSRRIVLKTGDNPEHFQWYRKTERVTILDDTYSLCANTKTFGIYQFLIRRYFFNETTQTEDFLETEYPLVVRLVPSFPGIFGNVLDSADSSVLDECWKDGKPVLSGKCSEQRSDVERTIQIWGGWYAICHGLVIFVVPLCLMVYIYCGVKGFLTLLQEGSFHPQRVNTLCQLPLSIGQANSRRASTDVSGMSYDVFLSYHRNDRHDSQNVKAYLTSNDLRVFDCQQDVPPGCPTLMACDRALLNSQSVVIIASPSYTACQDLGLQFQALNFHMLSQEIAEERMVILVSEPCHISRELGPLPVINLHQEKARQRLDWWIRNVCSRRHLDTSFRQVCADLRKYIKRLQFQKKSLCPTLNVVRMERRNNTHHSSGHGTQIAAHALQITMSSDSACQPSQEPTRAEKTEDGDAVSAVSCVPKRQTSGFGQFLSGNDSMSNNNIPEESGTQGQYSDIQSQTQSSVICESQMCLGGTSYMPPSDRKAKHDIFLTYCDESDYDSFLARKLTNCFEHQRLRVFDANHDVLPEQEETVLVSKGAESAAFVVVISPEYCRHQIMRRLHYPRVLQAVLSGRISLEHVLIIISAGRPTLLQTDASFNQLRKEHPGLNQHTHDDEITGTTYRDDEDPSSEEMNERLESQTNQHATRQLPAQCIGATASDLFSTASGQSASTDGQSTTAEDLTQETADGLQADLDPHMDNWRVPDTVTAFPNIIYWSSNHGDGHHLEEVTRWSQRVFNTVPAPNVRDLQNQHLQNRVQREDRHLTSFLRHLALG